MATKQGARRRQRGEVEELPSGALRVRVYAGADPVTGKRHHLIETGLLARVPPRRPKECEPACSPRSTRAAICGRRRPLLI